MMVIIVKEGEYETYTCLIFDEHGFDLIIPWGLIIMIGKDSGLYFLTGKTFIQYGSIYFKGL